MNITAQHIAPEEVMAFLDSEVSAVEAQAISAHVDDCVECAKVVEQLRRTSQALSAWKVSETPAKVEQSIKEVAARAGSGQSIAKPSLFVRASFWTYKRYAVVSVGLVSTLVIVVTLLTFNSVHSRHVAYMSREISPYSVMDGWKAKGGDRDKIQSRSRALQDVLPLPAEPEHMIARTVSLSIATKDFGASRTSLDSIVARYHGYSAELNVSTVENAPRNLQASLRIPAPSLALAVGDLKKLGRVENESQSGEEVTRQHADLVARLKNSRDTEERLRSILDQRTGKISEVLQVEREIARVRGEIESMEAEQKALEHRVDFATVELQLTEEYKAELNPPSASVAGRIRNAFISGYRNASDTLLGFFLFLAEYVPALLVWLVILAAPVTMLWRRYRRIRANV